MSSPLNSFRMPSHPPHLERADVRHATDAPDSPEGHGDPPHPDRAELSRHAAAVHISGIARKRSIVKPIVVGVVVLALTSVGVWQLDRLAAEASADQALAAPEVRSISTRRAQRAVFALADGSEATLAADSRLRIVPDFGEQRRLVGLEGAASFTVVDGRHPFQVKAGATTITALGTTFAVVAGTPADPVLVRVREGSVTVRTTSGTTDVEGMNAIVVEPTGTTRTPTPAELEESFAWVSGNVAVVDRSLRETLEVMKRWYALEVGVADSALLGRPITAAAPIQSSRRFLEAVQTSGKLQLVWVDKKIMLRDAPPARAARR